MSNPLEMLSKIKHRIPLLVILCFLVVCVSAETLFQRSSNPVAKRKSAKKIELKKSRLLLHRANFQPMVLLDSVILYHEGAYMYSDSAYLDDVNNTFEAFGNVRILQGDSITLVGDYMHYDGVFRLAKIRRNVVLEDKRMKMTLFTDSLNFDRIMNIAYYFDGGMVVDSLNELTSTWGQYEPALKLATFRDSVKLVNPQFVIHSDTLEYSTQNRVATILGPSVVVSDSGTIYSNRGWYNTLTQESMLLNQSLVVNKQKTQFLTGDSIFFNRAKSKGEVYGHMILKDTLRRVTLKGNRGHYDGAIRFAWASDSAQAIDYSQGDTLFLHADSLQMSSDGNFNKMKAFRRARFFRADVQGVADSLQYSTRDSIMHLFRDAVVWHDKDQIVGDTIHIFMKDSVVDRMVVKQDAYIMEQIDSTKFNQLKGRTITAYMANKQLKHVFVEGNAESIFYPQEKDGSFIGLNKTESGFLSIDFENKKIKKLKLWPQSNASTTPLPELKPELMRLKGCVWLDYLRPLNKLDIFRNVIRKPTDITPKRSSRFTTDGE
jgi:lipopolysaccharide export system protein LptA